MASDNQKHKKVAEFLEDNRWNMEKLCDFLPIQIVQEIVSIHAKRNSEVSDKDIWSFSKNGDYSVSSAYDFIENQVSD